MKEYYDRKELCALFDLEDGFLAELEAEDLVCPMELQGRDERVFPLDQVERVRIIANLVEDMEVNLAGCEVILEMRRNMIEMQRRFDAVVEALVSEVRNLRAQRGGPGM
jgi:MerR family transcriptional regulator/heat shock protein HspR